MIAPESPGERSLEQGAALQSLNDSSYLGRLARELQEVEEVRCYLLSLVDVRVIVTSHPPRQMIVERIFQNLMNTTKDGVDTLSA
jgi:hypothetical protein